jgi:sulfur relay protein TusB/DsrH
MHVGFILTKTPAEEGFNTFLKFLKIYIRNDDVTIYLLGNGVYCVIAKHSKFQTLTNILKTSNTNVYACLDDLKARGISVSSISKDVNSFVSYDEMVIDIMENLDQVFSF